MLGAQRVLAAIVLPGIIANDGFGEQVDLERTPPQISDQEFRFQRKCSQKISALTSVAAACFVLITVRALVECAA